jgi:hypothetical protein
MEFLTGYGPTAHSDGQQSQPQIVRGAMIDVLDR